jgi:hypothetical protein
VTARAAAGLWVVLLACTGDDGGGGSATGTGASSTTTDATGTASTSTTGSTTESDPPPACAACWEEACAQQIDACLADDACACRFACDNDPGCVIACQASPLFEELVLCIVDETLASCVVPCEAECEACLVDECGAEYQACRADRPCRCRLRCDGDLCDMVCGAETPVYEAFIACYADAAPACAMLCG